MQDGVAAAAAAAKELTKNLPSAALGRFSRLFGEADVGKASLSPPTLLTPPRDLPPRDPPPRDLPPRDPPPRDPPPRDLPPRERLEAPLASQLPYQLHYQLPSAAAADDDVDTARVAGTCKASPTAVTRATATCEASPTAVTRATATCEAPPSAVTRATATCEAPPSAVTSPALADNGTARRSTQAESAALRATLDGYEARLGRKLKKSDLAADPQMASTYHRYMELRQKYTDTV